MHETLESEGEKTPRDDRFYRHTAAGEVEIISPRLLTTAQVGEFLSVRQRTVLTWIKNDAIPYFRFPNGGDCRIPAILLLKSLGGPYDLTDDLALFLEQEDPGNMYDDDETSFEMAD